jgi:hypothetical protein
MEKSIFWADDYETLYRELLFIPNNSMTIIDKLNAIVRLSLLIGVFLIIFTGDIRYIVIPAITMIATYYLYNFRLVDLKTYFETYDNGHNKPNCPRGAMDNSINQNERQLDASVPIASTSTSTASTSIPIASAPAPMASAAPTASLTIPTEDNPLMNLLPMDPRDKPRAMLNVNNEELDAKITQMFNKNLYQDTGDIFNKENSQRQYVTMPSTSIPNDQTAAAKWMYQSPPTCKEDTIKCAPIWAPQ